jgi:hypothetical protein
MVAHPDCDDENDGGCHRPHGRDSDCVYNVNTLVAGWGLDASLLCTNAST